MPGHAVTVFLVIGAVAALCVIVILSAVPELLAAALTAGVILGVYYPLQPTERAYTVTQTPPETSIENPGELGIITDPGSGAVTLIEPLPEYIQVGADLWADMVAAGQDWYILEQQAGQGEDAEPVWQFSVNADHQACRYLQVDSPVADAGPVFHLEFQTSW